LTLISTGFWAWPITEGRILLWFGLVVLVSTPLLTIGWWLISLISSRYAPLKMIKHVENFE